MFESKLAQSVQRDYRQAAENHHLNKVTGNVPSRFNPLKVMAMITPLLIFVASFI